MATEGLDFFSIYSESSKLIRLHSSPFLALSLLFIFPFYLSVVAFPALQHIFTNNNTSPELRIVFFFLYTLTLLTLALCGTGTITYSYYHVFFGRPVKLIDALKSFSRSLFGLYATFFCALLIILMSLVGVGVIVLTIIKVIESFGFEFEYSSVYFRVLSVTGKVVLGLGLVYIYLHWVLAPVVVVVESSWGLEALRRSAYLVKGRRGVVFCLVLLHGVLLYSSLLGSWAWETGFLITLKFVMLTVIISTSFMLFSVQSVAANTVLYVNCKDLRGELAGEIVEEFAQEYVSLPLDEEKVPHLVSIVQP